jgi:hypothetical protein
LSTIKVTNVFLTIVFKVGLLPCLRLATTRMKRDTLIEHKEAAIVCEESGSISLNYNVILTTPEANIVTKPKILIIITKSSLTFTNCGKTGHTLETCHNMKKRY